MGNVQWPPLQGARELSGGGSAMGARCRLLPPPLLLLLLLPGTHGRDGPPPVSSRALLAALLRVQTDSGHRPPPDAWRATKVSQRCSEFRPTAATGYLPALGEPQK